MSTSLLLLPDFALILLGALIRRWLLVDAVFWQGLEKLVYFVLFPALLINSATRAHIVWSAAAPLMLTALGAMLMSAALTLALRRAFAVSDGVYASLFQCSFRFNSYLGLASVALFWGQEGIVLMSLILAVCVPMANLIAVWKLARHGEKNIWQEMLKNPLLVATLFGLALNVLEVPLAKPLTMLLGRLGDASIALGLLSVGAALVWRGMDARELPFSCYLLAAKLLWMPLAALLLGHALGLSPTYLAVGVLFAALPTASSAYILAVRMGGVGQPVAWQISASTLISMLTLPIIVAWVSRP